MAGWIAGVIDAPPAECILVGDDDAHTEGGEFPPGSFPPVAVGKPVGAGQVVAIHDLEVVAHLMDNHQFLRNVMGWLGPTSGVAPSGVPGAVPPALALAPNAPNPFNLGTTVRYQLPSAAHVDLSIFDVAGRLVRRLVVAEQPAGRHAVVWDGRSSDGRQLGSGVYICRLEAGGRTVSRRMMLLE